MTAITKEELKSLIDKKEDFFLINLLPYDEFKKKHIPTSHNIPLKSEYFKELILDVIEDKNKKIILYSKRNSKKNKKAESTLRKLGYTDISEYQGGIEDWQERFSLEGKEA